MKKLFLPFIGLGAIALAMSLNLSHAADGYGLLKNSLALQVLAQSSSSGGSSSGVSSSGVSSGQSGPNGSGTGNAQYYCREVNCTGTWKGTADASGCVTIFGKKRCAFSANLEVTHTYSGKNENCTGGTVWDDCNACQKDCVESSSGSTSS